MKVLRMPIVKPADQPVRLKMLCPVMSWTLVSAGAASGRRHLRPLRQDITCGRLLAGEDGLLLRLFVVTYSGPGLAVRVGVDLIKLIKSSIKSLI